jgi:hypothetical protein
MRRRGKGREANRTCAISSSLFSIHDLSRRLGAAGHARWRKYFRFSNFTRKAMLVQEGKDRPDRTSRSTPGNGLAIRDRLAKSDPGNALWQRDLIASYKMIADCSPSKEKRANFSRALDCERAVSLQAARARRRMNAR